MILRNNINFVRALNRTAAAFMMLVTTACTTGPHANTPVTSATARAQLIALQDVWIAAEIAGDAKTLERIFDKQFLSTWASGKTIDRQDYIDAIVGADIAPFKVVTDRVIVHGDTGLVISRTEDGGTKFTWIAINRDSGWRVISQTFSNVKKPK